MEPFNWKCPFCNHAGVITDDVFQTSTMTFDMKNKHGARGICLEVVVCPNRECREFALLTSLHSAFYARPGGWTLGELIHTWKLVPESHAKVFPDYIPAAILQDYREACLISEKSPKAAATLARRCLQGMIRDFWDIKKESLYKEIDALRDKVDGDTWEAIDSLRKVGNIGAHMEKDIGLILDVEPKEAALLIQLLETLLTEWYVHRHNRQQRMDSIKQLAIGKDAERKAES